MKRIMLRMSALGTVVALGLIAIAQAQRGNSVDAEVADAPPADAARPLSGAMPTHGSNPLRSDAAASSAGSTPPPRLFMETPPRGRDASTAPPTELPESRPADPFTRPPGGPQFAPGPADAGAGHGSAALASHLEEQRGPEGMRLAEGGGRQLQPYPSGGADRYPALRPPEDEGSPAGFGGPQLGMPLPEVTAASSDAGPTDPIPIPRRDETEPVLLPVGPRANAGASGRPMPSDAGGEVLLGEGTGQPGGKHLEGAQSPQISIEKVAPTAMQVGKPATFRVKVRNTGSVAATGLEVRDQVPKGTQLTSTNPRASRGTRGELVWSLGTLDPGEEATVEMEVTPVQEGEIGSVATVHFSASASAKGVATKPELVLESSAPSQVLIGETLTLSITLSNPGSGVANGVVLTERVPPGLRHPAGADLEYDVGTLNPGESRKLELELVADRAGRVTNVILARGEANLRAEHRLDIDVVAPQLELAVEGPQRRFLEREAVYDVAISNPGTAPAQNVELVAHLPDGLEFVSANNAGYYDEAARAVHWRLEELPVRETGVVKLVTMPVRAGEHSLRIRSTAAKGVEAESEQSVLIEGIAAILFEVRDAVDPIEVGGETVYEISVLNQGSKAATNVRVHVVLPPEMQPVAAEGPTQHQMDGRQVVFEPLSRLAPKADTMYRVRVRGLEPGDLRTRVQVLTDEMRGVPVTKEESTRVYSDR